MWKKTDGLYGQIMKERENVTDRPTKKTDGQTER